MSIEILNPGSEAAIRAGCICAVIDNHHGEGIRRPNGDVDFWINGDCPLHGLLTKTPRGE